MTRSALRCAGAFAVLLAALSLCGLQPPASTAARTNVLLVTIDTLRADRVGAYGGRIAKTPTLDRLAADGALFEQAIVQVPLTRASHATILTGLQPFQHGIRDNFAPPLAPEHRTLAEMLKSQGYVTGGFVGSFIVNRQSGLQRGFDEFDDTFETGSKGSRFFSDYQRRAAEVEAKAGPWIERAARSGKPFFAWVHFYDPHSPYNPPPPYRTTYAQHPYEGEIAYTDDVLGRLLGRLDRLGVRDRTLVVVTADHGEMLGEHGEKEHGFFVYDSAVRVPLILRLPGRIAAAVRVKTQARSIDLVPTILDLAGARSVAPRELAGRSLVPAIDAPMREEPSIAYSESLFAQIHFGWGELRAVRTAGWKYIQAPRPELYDVTRDPGEKNNRFAAESRRAASMRSRLLDAMGGSLETQIVAGGTTKLDPATLQRLASLGYVTGPGGAGGSNEDPKDKVAEFMAYGDAVRRGVEAYERGDLQAAIKGLQAVVSAGRGGFDVSYYLGRSYLRLGNAEAAIPHLQQAIKKLPTYTPSYIDLARAFMLVKKYDEAVRSLQEGLALDPENFQFHSHLGYIARLQADLPTARAHYEKARALEPDDFDVRMTLASVYRDMGDPRRALAEVDAAVKLRADSADAHNQRGMLLGGMGDNAGAASAFERAANLDPKNEGTWFNLGLARLRAGNKPAAAAAFREALKIKPAFDEARKFLAEAER